MTTAIRALTIEGYRCFGSARMSFGVLNVLVGPNGTGKTALFEFLRFLRESMRSEMPPEIVPGAIGQQVFHRPGEDRIRWSLGLAWLDAASLEYEGQVLGPVGRGQVSLERVHFEGQSAPAGATDTVLLEVRAGIGKIIGWDGEVLRSDDVALGRPNRLVLGTVMNPAFSTLFGLRDHILNWRFYSSFRFDFDRIRRPVPIEQTPQLREDCGNLSSVLHYLVTEHPDRFREMSLHMRLCVPGMESLRVKARGGPGEVMTFWKEGGVDEELTMADLSDGTLRLLCWMALCFHPEPPTLVCIDEPDQGLHPKVLPTLQGMLEKATERTQLLVTTHSSYFLSLFPLDNILVMSKDAGGVQGRRAGDSATLKSLLEDFEGSELERMHRNDELETLL